MISTLQKFHGCKWTGKDLYINQIKENPSHRAIFDKRETPCHGIESVQRLLDNQFLLKLNRDEMPVHVLLCVKGSLQLNQCLGPSSSQFTTMKNFSKFNSPTFPQFMMR